MTSVFLKVRQIMGGNRGRLTIGILFGAFYALSCFSQEKDSSIFVVPDVLKDNVTFWKKIYTEINLHEGVLHDMDYPLVIYKKVTLDQTSGWSSSRFIESQKDLIASCLKHIETQPESTWTDDEKTIARLYKDHAPQGALAGAHDRVRFQLGQKERFRQGLERSTAYLDTIRSIFSQHHVPMRLAYLPHVESSFNAEAYSKVGAAGLWQFMRSTGRLFLKVNYLVDERRDPILATFAAAKLLQGNYQEVQSWPLAITAYNHGLNGMKRAVETTGSRDIGVIINNYSSPSFQFASKNFYACFLAASDIAMHPNDYFSDLHFAKKIEFKNINLPSYMRPSVICKSLNVDQGVLREFNPALRPVVFSQQKQLPAGYEIRVPLDVSLVSAQKAFASIPDSLKSSEPERSDYYSVQSGDNLYSIASRFGVSITQLIMENNISRKNRIYEGQVLRVPQFKRPSEAGAVQLASAEPPQEPESTVAEKTTETPSPAIPPASVPPSVPWAPVDTAPPPQEPRQLAPIAPVRRVAALPPKLSVKPKPPVEQQPVSAPETPIASLKGLSDSLKEIVLARADTVPAPDQGSKPSLAPKFDVDVYNLEVTLSPVGNTAEITVSVDETIGHYADWLGIPTYRIRQLNRMGGRSDIRINRPLSIPADQVLLEKFVKARLEYHMAIEEDFYGRYKVIDVKQKTIRRGETLWDICNGQDLLPLWLFKKYNKQLDLGKLMPGALAWIPVIEEKTEKEIQEDAVAPGALYPSYGDPEEIPRTRGVIRMP
ncbi:MAG: transglycosylase SLT domain-containing protein [Chitinivibrionales bacterium]